MSRKSQNKFTKMPLSKRPPFPWFGGKTLAATIVWPRFSGVTNYIEPFAGSLAMLLMAPEPVQTETVNDIDGFICNFWRSIRLKPDETAHYADWPVSECDLTARHAHLVSVRDEFTDRLCSDPDYCDPLIAGWWVWGVCSWIGSGWCSGTGPWMSINGKLEKVGNRGRGINRQLPRLGDRGSGINRQLPHLSDRGSGINRQLPHLGNRGRWIREWFNAISDRLRNVRVACGDWRRVLGRSVTHISTCTTAVFLDPPYEKSMRTSNLYAKDEILSSDVATWAIKNGDDPRLRIAFCGLDDEHDFPGSWDCVAWRNSGSYARRENAVKNRHSERIWFSPHCSRQLSF